MDKPTKPELALDILGTAIIDALALAGIVSVIPYTADDLVGAIAVMLILSALGVAYTGVVIGDDRRRLKQS
jgi:hypothetical protein